MRGRRVGVVAHTVGVPRARALLLLLLLVMLLPPGLLPCVVIVGVGCTC